MSAVSGQVADGLIVYEGGRGTKARTTSVQLVDPESVSFDMISRDHEAHEPAVSDDGTKVAFSRPSADDPSRSDVYVQDLATTGIKRIGPGHHPTWTVDQDALLVSREDGVHRMGLDGRSELVRGGESLRGTEVAEDTFVFGDGRTLSLDVDRDDTIVFDGVANCGPDAWDLDPDGRELAFTVGCTEAEDPHSGLFVYDLDTKQTTTLHEGDLHGAAWSPDGTSIATTYLPDRNGSDNSLWVVDAATGDERVLHSLGWHTSPTWH